MPFARVLEVALIVRDALDAAGHAELREDDRLARHPRVRADRPRADAEAGVDVRQGVRADAGEAAAGADHRRVPDRQAPAGPRARRLQPERVGADAGVGLFRAPKPRAPVSMPVTWKEIEQGVTIEQFTLKNARQRIKKLGDLWKPLLPRQRGRGVDLSDNVHREESCCHAMHEPRRSMHSIAPYPPMEAKLVDDDPAAGRSWQYEPKWDGFRCLAFRDGDKVELQSKAGQPLARYFPEIVEALRR